MNGILETGAGYSRMRTGTLDVPVCMSSVYEDEGKSNEEEMQPPTEENIPSDLLETWNLNYHEAAIFLEEGENNVKFDFHPRSKSALPAYLLVHNTWFYILDLLASLMLLALALLEKPSVPGFETTEGVHGSLELCLLGIQIVEMSMKVRWMGVKPFLKHKRTVIKTTVLCVMIVEAITVLIRQTSHIRVTRALRPVFLIDNHFCNGVRRAIRQILQTLPPIIDMLVLLFFFMSVFSVLGFYIFSSNPKDPYFSTLPASVVSLFVLLTTANYPDVMMPSYENCRWSSIFFMAFLIIHVFFLMNLMLAVVYESFTKIEKSKFRKLLFHRRRACAHAFQLLVNKSSPVQILFKHFEGFMRFYKPSASRQDVYLMFKTLDTNRSGTLSKEEFYQVYEVTALKWKPKKKDDLWFTSFASSRGKTLVEMIHKMVTWKWTDLIINLVILTNGIWQLIEAIELSIQQPKGLDDSLSLTSWISIIFVSFYALEAILKMIGLGLNRYFQSGWNSYDFVVTLFAVIGLIVERFSTPFSFVVILRPLRLLRLFKLKKRYRDVMGTVFILLPRFFSVAMVLILVYYVFAILGIEIFSEYDMKNCCKNTTVESFFKYENNSVTQGYYYLNNFQNILISGVTLFELMVVNNWFILMDGYAIVTSQWSRIYFMLFYIVTMVVLNIIVAFILEAFLFRIAYKRKMGNMDKDSLIKVDVSLTLEEVEFCRNPTQKMIEEVLRESENSEPVLVYRGTRNRTKFSFSLKMYGEEVKEWVKKEEDFEKQRIECRLALSNTLEADISEEEGRRTQTM